jgi:hypothetical protein
MSWCPKCRLEYQEGFTTCGDCGATLVDELAPLETRAERKTAYDTESFLMTVQDETQASIIESLLHSFNIRTARNYRGAGSYVKVITGTSIFGIDILVPSRDLNKARAIVGANFPLQAETRDARRRQTGGSTPLRRRVAKWLVVAYLISVAAAVLVRFVR